MRRWSGPPANPAQFDVTRVRQIGEWGRASRHLGSRWEALGLERLAAAVARREPVALLAVCADASLSALLAATGSKNPDVVLAFATDDTLLLQPADLKWSLDVASYQQISAEVLDHLLDRVPRLREDVLALIPDGLRTRPVVTRDGFFFSPRTYANERFLTSSENKHQEYPLEASEVVLETVEPNAFFEVLPGWQTARELARLDGSLRGMGQIDTADRYYHFGAGAAGALASLEGSIFDDEVPVEPEEEIERFQAFSRTLSPPSTATIIDRLGVRMRQRQELVRRLRDLVRASYTFRDFATTLVAEGHATEGQPERELRAQWGDRYRALVESEEAEIRGAGRALRADGATDVEALEALERDRPSFARRVRSRALTLIRGAAERPPG